MKTTRIYSSIPVSTKKAVEVCRFIRNRSLADSKNMLNGLVNKTIAVPLKRYMRSAGHKKGIGPGKYHVKTAEHILHLLNNLEKNAVGQGMDEKTLYISRIVPNKGTTTIRYGRHRSRRAKSTNIEVVASEKVEKNGKS